GRLITVGRTILLCMITAGKTGGAVRAWTSVSIGPTASTAKFWTRLFRPVPANGSCGNIPLPYWLEAARYDVTYVSNLDTHSGAAGLRRAKGFLSVGHDEYYSLGMYQNLRRAIAGGLNVAFLSGNTCCGRIELRPSSTGMPCRIYGRTDYFG